MAIDNTHTKYLRGSDKRVWGNYGKALKGQREAENFLGGIDEKE